MLLEELRVAVVGAESRGTVAKLNVRHTRNAHIDRRVVLCITRAELVQDCGREGLHVAEHATGEKAARRIAESSSTSGTARPEAIRSLEPVKLQEQAVAGVRVKVDTAGSLIPIKQVAQSLNLRTEYCYAVEFKWGRTAHRSCLDSRDAGTAVSRHSCLVLCCHAHDRREPRRDGGSRIAGAQKLVISGQPGWGGSVSRQRTGNGIAHILVERKGCTSRQCRHETLIEQRSYRLRASGSICGEHRLTP